LGGGTYFVEETSLAYNPALSFDSLEDRLYRRLAWMGVKLIEIQHIERCLFPMDLPLPNLRQRVMGYGGAASMVHPATGYQVGAALRRAAEVAQAIAKEFGKTYGTPGKVARAAWQTLWPIERVRRRNLYLFGLENLMRLDYTQINGFFYTFFGLPFPEWTGYLSDNLSTRGLLWTMLRLFYRAPGEVRRALAGSIRHQTPLLWKVLWG
jgi:lycopene beta-cyclase